MNLSKNFTLEEMLESEVGRKHKIVEQWNPGGTVIFNLTELCINLLQPLRDALGPIHISSGYRCSYLNHLVGGVSNSGHIRGEAVDCEYYGEGGNQAIIDKVRELNLPFDQMIDEANLKWVHLSYRASQNRKQILRMVDGKYEMVR